MVAQYLKVADTEMITGRPQLRQPELRDRSLVMTVLSRFDLPRRIAELAVRAGHDHRTNTFC